MPDPQLPINCPTCGKPLIYVRTVGETHFYWCLRHGSLVLPPLEQLRPENLTDSRDEPTTH
jgi:hypothetical protein